MDINSPTFYTFVEFEESGMSFIAQNWFLRISQFSKPVQKSEMKAQDNILGCPVPLTILDQQTKTQGQSGTNSKSRLKVKKDLVFGQSTLLILFHLGISIPLPS